jgi:lysozyme
MEGLIARARERAREMTKRHEGLKLKPYRCPAGKLTIGYGRNLDDVGVLVEEAEFLLDNDLDAALRGAESVCKQYGISFSSLDESVQVALVCMAFQLGESRLCGFKRMFAALRGGDRRAARQEALESKWARQTPRRAQEIADLIYS